jgi:hypothetical protein
MAKFTIKGKKVKGTNGKDKITWQNKKAWQKALTVNAAAGNDVINFAKSKYNNIFYGDAGNDTITAGIGNDKIYGGKGKDTINAGKGNNTIYFNKGDGTDTILNGGGVDTLVFSKETTKTLKAKISGKNIVLTGKKGKNTVILKNYMSSGHSAQYVQIGKKKVKVETLLPVKNITGNTKTINGTHLRDNITVNADEATVNALSGDDTINVYGTEFNINPGKGNDVINLLNPLSEPKRGTITINKGDGNNTINGIGDMMVFMDSAALTINSDGLVRYLGGLTPYIFGDMSSQMGLTLKLTSGEELVITGFFADNRNYGKLGVYIPMYNQVVPIVSVLKPETTVIDITANKAISITKDGTMAGTVDNGKHTVNIYSSSNQVMFSGGTNTVNIISGQNNFFFFNTGTSNTIDITADKNANIDFYNNDNTVTTAEASKTVLRFDSEDLSKASKLYLHGNDEIQTCGNLDITLSGNADKSIFIESENAITEIKGVTDTKSTYIDYDNNSGTRDIVFSHYSLNKDTEGNDFITLLSKDENGNLLNSETKIWGKWEGKTFDLEGLGKDKLEIGYYSGGSQYPQIGLNENTLTQYVDMGNNAIGTDGGYKKYTLGSGVLGIAKDVYINGTTESDKYECISTADLTKQYTISDKSGNDVLSISESKDNFRFFFDVSSSGKVIGEDLYIFSYDGSSSTDLGAYILNKGVLNGGNGYVEIEDFFGTATGTNIFRYGAGRIETIEDSASYTSNDEYLIGAIATSAWNWLKGHNSGLTADDANYCTSIRDAMNKGFANAALVTAYSDNNIWNGEYNWTSPV